MYNVDLWLAYLYVQVKIIHFLGQFSSGRKSGTRYNGIVVSLYTSEISWILWLLPTCIRFVHVCYHLQVAGRLAEFRDLVKEVVRSACRTALLEAGFTPDDYFMDMDSPMGMYAGMFVMNITPIMLESWCEFPVMKLVKVKNNVQ